MGLLLRSERRAHDFLRVIFTGSHIRVAGERFKSPLAVRQQKTATPKAFDAYDPV